MSKRISEDLLDRGDGEARNLEKMLVIADALMRQVEQSTGERGAAFEQFRRAAVLEKRVRQRTHDLEATLKLLNEANSAAERARRDLSQAIEAIEEGFALFDPAEVLVMCNSRFCRDLTDVREKLLPGITFTDYVEAASRSAILALPKGMTAKAWAAERIRLRHTRQVFNVGLRGDRWLQVSEQRTADGGTVILQTDITDIIRMERSERGKLLDDQARMIRATLEHINQGVGIFDANRRLVGWNSRIAQLLDIPPRLLRRGIPFQLLANHVMQAVTVGDGLSAGMVREWIDGGLPRKPLSFELQHISGIILDVFAQEMPGRGFVMSFADVTRERLAIHAMIRANSSLEARVASRTGDLAAALAEAERANSARVRFVAAASHDLLQPLSAAKLFVDAARDDAGDISIRGTLEKAHNALVSVEGILGALLDISRLEAGGAAMDIGPVSLSLLLRQLTDEFAPIAARKGLRLNILPCALTVSSDPTYLRRILQNLISNAIRYTASGRVLVGPRRSGGQVRIEIHDTGPGIAADQQQAIFREFHRVQGSASASEGMGLGLAIVERACALLGHRLALHSQIGRGTCFSVELTPVAPRASPSYREATPVIPDEPGDNSDRIALLVENDMDLRRAIALLLERRGVSVLEAASGEEALSLLEEIGIVPDLYLVDQQLDGAMTGIETVEALHAQHGERPTRILTADRKPQTRMAAEAAGIEIMYKPIAADALEAFVLHAG
ncbi:hybrid sensor histidine kinase/response regulator [Shinella zoogloeoides]|uniref:histidine kinase n=1 Tax=Shinella zoogloeoides TaxID=352475 RepID=A0A6N8TIC4_SHIZO|nr:PAS-domain containing protein [Shinella zoogloeoides]MXO02689.1 response regulator [Shinella zoogloeoides]UEX84227.1 PAS-domain containing protein [Shinella zoogloeoides]